MIKINRITKMMMLAILLSNGSFQVKAGSVSKNATIALSTIAVTLGISGTVATLAYKTNFKGFRDWVDDKMVPKLQKGKDSMTEWLKTQKEALKTWKNDLLGKSEPAISSSELLAQLNEAGEEYSRLRNIQDQEGHSLSPADRQFLQNEIDKATQKISDLQAKFEAAARAENPNEVAAVKSEAAIPGEASPMGSPAVSSQDNTGPGASNELGNALLQDDTEPGSPKVQTTGSADDEGYELV